MKTGNNKAIDDERVSCDKETNMGEFYGRNENQNKTEYSRSSNIEIQTNKTSFIEFTMMGCDEHLKQNAFVA